MKFIETISEFYENTDRNEFNFFRYFNFYDKILDEDSREFLMDDHVNRFVLAVEKN